MARKSRGDDYGFVFNIAGVLLGIGLARKAMAPKVKGDAMPGQGDTTSPKKSPISLHVAQYRLDDGSLSTDKAFAKRITAADIVQAITPFTYLAPGYFVGTSTRETGLVLNEVDTDYRSDGTVKRTTYGPFQSNNSGDETSLAMATKNFARDAETIMRQIAVAAKFDPMHPPRDAYAYLAWGHNAGTTDPVSSILKYGMNWAKTIQRNQEAWKGDCQKDKPESGAGYMVCRMIPYAQEVLRQVDLYPAKLKVV